MVEELKIIADVLKGVSASALNGVIAYLVFAYIKPVTIWMIGSVTVVKALSLFKPVPLGENSVKVIRVVEES